MDFPLFSIFRYGIFWKGQRQGKNPAALEDLGGQFLKFN
jgi:hypothetical protein